MSDRPCVVGLITARGGSKGIPGKNIHVLAGKPMIAWTIEAARDARQLDRVIVSTDDDAIAEVARQFGAEVPFKRPAELAQDGSPHIAVIQHALHWLAEHDGVMPSHLVLLQPTSPLRTAEDVDGIVSKAIAAGAPAMISVCEPLHHPFLLKKVAADGTLTDFVAPGMSYARRQEFPPVYAVNGALYFCDSSVVMNHGTLQPPGTRPYIMPVERSLDIDEHWQLELAEMILQRRSADGSQRSASK